MIVHSSLNVALGTINPYQLEQLRNWRNDPRVFKWCRQNDLITDASHRSWFANISRNQEIKMYAIWSVSPSKFVGVCGLTSIDLINQRAEFSLYVDPGEQGKGYGKEALKLLIHHAFNSYPLNIVWGESFEGNKAMKTFEEIGFVKEGTRRDFYFRDGKFIDAHLFSIKRGELKI